jgi:hypothetical protein
VVDAVVVLCGGILTGMWYSHHMNALMISCSGILGASELIESLVRDRVLPRVLSSQLPLTGARPGAILAFGAFCAAIYGISSASLSIVSKMWVRLSIEFWYTDCFVYYRFSVVWLWVMSLFPLAALFLKFNRGRMQRSLQSPLSITLIALVLVPIILAGNIVIDPTIIG